MSEERLTAELHSLLDDGGFLKLVEVHGGQRLYVPSRLSAEKVSKLTDELGKDLADRLILRYGGAYIRVPLARTFKARHYRAEGKSNPQIARLLKMTETGVEKLFRRERRKMNMPDPRQTDLFTMK